MTNTSVTVFSPATVGNVACGFDVLGFAVGEPGDEVKATLSDEVGVRITKITGDGGVLPVDVAQNAASVGVIQLLLDLNVKNGIDIELHKKMPLGSGLGSSAASAVGGVYATNAVLGYPLTREELVPYAMMGEAVACGTAHADNVAPSLLGGFVAIRSYEPLEVIRIPTELELFCLLVKPRVEVMTEEAREVLGNTVTLKQHVTQTGNLSGLIVGLMTQDVDLIGRSMMDVIAEPKRSQWIPHYDDIKANLLKHGAIGCCISGSGPSVFSLFTDIEKAKQAEEKMRDFDVDLYLTKVNQEGVQVVERGDIR
jgi:homoserine kinase